MLNEVKPRKTGKTIIILLLIVANKISIAQNVGIGTTEPYNKLQVAGNLVVTTPTTATGTAPTAVQTKTMLNASTISFAGADSVGRIYDPGGPAGNYIANLNASADIPVSSNIAIELTVETMDIGSGDFLIIRESVSGITLLTLGNGNNSTGKWVFNNPSLYINFKSNADASTGAGFSLMFRRLYNNSQSLPDVSGIAGAALFFDIKSGAFRSGKYGNDLRGNYSTASGLNNIASGSYSTAMGYSNSATATSSIAMGYGTTANADYSVAMGTNTTANGSASTAMGFNTVASGFHSTALGHFTTASGSYSTAIGFSTTASQSYSTAIGYNSLSSGYVSTAMGVNTTASGDYSTAMGNYVSTNGHEGSFVMGDNSTSTVMNSANANNFRARFAGGYKLFTSANLSTGCTLFAGDNAWTTGSSVHTKENFAEINGEDFLQKISRFNLTSWNYKTQDPKTFRHYGPMAQDFYAAFGSDAYGTIGNDTTINSADFAGVSFIAIQALEKRTQKIKETEKQIILQQATIEEMQKQIAELKSIIHQKNIKK